MNVAIRGEGAQWTAAEWKARREAYVGVWTPWVKRRRERRSRGVSHPVEDFLWEYVAARGGRLLRWHPGIGVALEGASEEAFPSREGYAECDGARQFDAEAWRRKRGGGTRWILTLQRRMREREPQFGCLGLHEWAMVYQAEDVRHPQLSLRLPHADIRAVVEELPLMCTHYDAFRFFSREARPLNAAGLSPDNRVAHEQPGCLHANMDLFKWCLKLQPLVGSELLTACFRLSLRAREVDMRASPYDVSGYGLEAIAIETVEGRRDYVREQRAIAKEAVPLRDRLIAVLAQALEAESEEG